MSDPPLAASASRTWDDNGYLRRFEPPPPSPSGGPSDDPEQAEARVAKARQVREKLSDEADIHEADSPPDLFEQQTRQEGEGVG